MQNSAGNQANKFESLLKVLLGSLIGLFISGAAMTAIGQPTASHSLTTSGNTFWHILLIFHLLLLIALTISAIWILGSAITKAQDLKVRAITGMLAIVFGIVSGILVLHKIHPGIFLFCMAIAFLLIGFIYGPLAGHG